MLRILMCPWCNRSYHSCICKVISEKIMIGDEFLLEIQEDMIRLFKYDPIGAKFRYHTSREVINDEVQWLNIDHVIVPDETQKHINSVVKNLAFL